jgi:4-amino-4-deoxy-L-arabinose transferase-like glycosyltransferase
MQRALVPLLIAALLTAHAGLLAWSAHCHSLTIDEVGHLPAGLSLYHFGTFALYKVNPPLVKALAALPVYLAGPTLAWGDYGDWLTRRTEWMVGKGFVAANGERAFWYFTLGRWACVPLSLLGGLVCYRWAAELSGRPAGLLALALWCSSPTVLAYAALITPDAGAAALGVAAGYCFWRWLRGPSWRRALLAGLALGLVELTKMTWIILFGLWPLLWLAWHAPALWCQPGRGRQAAQLGAILALGLYLLNAGYLFEGSLRQLGDFTFVSAALGGDELRQADVPAGGNRFRGTWLAEVPVPLPEHYVGGLDLQKRDFEQRMPSYLRGEHRVGGWWYYHFYALGVKEPLGTWALLLLAAGCWAWSRRYRAGWRDELVLLAPAAAVLALVSSQTGFSRYVRYVLPALPFLFIWAGKVACALDFRDWKVAAVAAGALAWSAGSSLSVYPHSLSYFNELAGGPARGHEHLIDANVDWGQDLFFLKAWSDAHPEARPLHLACFSYVPPLHYGLDGPDVPTEPRPGWFAISVHHLHDPAGRFDYFRRLRPVARVGYSTHIYHLSPAEAEQLREQAGGRRR